MSDAEPSGSFPEPVTGATPPMKAADRQPWPGKQWLLYVGLPILFCVMLIGGPLEQLLLGWLYFPLRVIPLVSVDWPTTMLGLVSMLGFVFGLHRTILWFLDNSSRPVAGKIRWSCRSTMVLAMTLALMFASGTAMVGATHQFIWLLTARSAKQDHPQRNSQRTSGLFGSFFHDARQKARDNMQKHNLKEIGLAMHNVHDVYRYFPPGGTMAESGELLHGWSIFLGSYMTYSNFEVDFSIPWNQPPNDRLYQCALPQFINPAISGPVFDEQGYGISHVSGNVHVLPICRVANEVRNSHDWATAVKKSNQVMNSSKMTDGMSNTILVGTAAGQFKPWGHPANLRDPSLGINRAPSGFGGPPHWKGAMMVMCDGSVRLYSEQTDMKLMKALSMPSGGENIDTDHLDVQNQRR